MYVAEGLLTDFEQRSLILKLREVWSVIRKPYDHCWSVEKIRTKITEEL